MAFVDQRLSSRKAVSIGGVVLVHLAIGYAFVNGLALKIVPFIEHHTILLPANRQIPHHRRRCRPATAAET